MNMWKSVMNYLPEWKIYIQALITFLIPFSISRLFNWIRSFKEEYEIEKTEDRTKTAQTAE